MSDEWHFEQSFARLETATTQKRLFCDYVLTGLDETRKHLLLRRALGILAAEEKRLYELTDSQALAELDALKESQDKQFVQAVNPMPRIADMPIGPAPFPHGAGDIH